jgi:hypothetical protein
MGKTKSKEKWGSAKPQWVDDNDADDDDDDDNSIQFLIH